MFMIKLNMIFPLQLVLSRVFPILMIPVSFYQMFRSKTLKLSSTPHSLTPQIQSISKPIGYSSKYSQNLTVLITSTASTLVQTTIISHQDYFNCFLTGFSASSCPPLKSILYTEANSCKSDCTALVFMSLQ